MSKRILLCLDKNQFEPFDFSIDYIKAMVAGGGNSGNNVFQYSLQKLLKGGGNEVTVDTDFLRDVTHHKNYFDEINSNYDCLVFSPANTLAEYAVSYELLRWGNKISHVKIPVYALGLGAQSDGRNSMGFVDKIKTQAATFIKNILETGGALGLRGNFSGEVVEKLGFTEQDYTIIGCPSLFCNGPDLQVYKKQISAEEFIPAFNGFKLFNTHSFHEYFSKYPKSIFVCQEEFYRLLYKPHELTWKETQYLKDNRFLNLYLQDRVQLYCDFPLWTNDFKAREINFSFGCRVHGNIVPLLAGIPAYIDAFDSRTRELAEYFDIPHFDFGYDFPDPFDLYEKADFTGFNKNFRGKYEIFENLMLKFGIKLKITEINHGNFKPYVISPESKAKIQERAFCEHTNQKVIDTLNQLTEIQNQEVRQVQLIEELQGRAENQERLIAELQGRIETQTQLIAEMQSQAKKRAEDQVRHVQVAYEQVEYLKEQFEYLKERTSIRSILRRFLQCFVPKSLKKGKRD